MRRFTFRLDSILRLRQYEEKVARQQLQEALSRLAVAERDLDTLQQHSHAVRQRRRQLVQQGAEAALLAACAQNQAALDAAVQLQRGVVRDLEALVAKRREEYLARQRERQTMEELKDQAWQEFQAEELRAEQSLLDEVALSGHIHRLTTDW